jgi:hypothetical protein
VVSSLIFSVTAQPVFYYKATDIWPDCLVVLHKWLPHTRLRLHRKKRGAELALIA